ncbi:aldose 1-epimerase [Vibrio misgurnus]|uniref:aldose 1-epimerase n=1 Tax=Vibrio misgurnus TaxID=2993714 RepID=UPI00241783AF|nr:aldose 1-epimerase [Vibrio sp. gvc]
MFKLIKNNFGKFKATTILNSERGIQVDIIHDFGAIINQYRINHSPFSFIVGYQDSHDLIQSHPFFSRSAKLFPFPNRLKDGHYRYRQQDYQLTANFPWSEHAVHGLLYNQPFQPIAHKTTQEYAQATFRFETNKLVDGYPFAFRLDVQYHINHQGRLSCTTTITNLSTEPFPFGDAWHPYFSLGCDLDQCQLMIDPQAEVQHQNDLPTGTLLPNEQFLIPTSLEGISLNHCYQFSSASAQSIRLTRNDQQAALSFEQGSGYSFVQLYTPPSEASIAIEPMTCPADAFNNHIGLLELAPTQSVQLNWHCQAQWG